LSLRPERILRLLGDDSLVRELVVLETVDSTNEELRRRAALGASEGTVVAADRQTAGRGRLGRQWHSPPGCGLYVSILLRPAEPPATPGRWTLGAAVAAGEACRALSGIPVQVDWPNDLQHAGRKLGGVLADLRCGSGGAAELVLGTGINVTHEAGDFPEELRGTATSLALAAPGRAPEREDLAAAYLRALGSVIRLLQAGDWNEVARRWERLAPGAQGRRVRVRPPAGHSGPGAYEGLTAGLDPTGALRVLRSDGSIAIVHAADGVDSLEG
jgi:BirA family biotin operon repressor/biotin-[acetyl-CoA-carboxylase] ligase